MKFIVLGDLHYTVYSDPAQSAARDHFFETLFRSVMAQKADLVFAIGDLVHAGEPAELDGLYALAERVGVRLLSVTGNHDFASHTKEELRPYFVAGAAGRAEFYDAFSQAGVRFVLLDTARELLSDTDWSGYVSPAQQAWLAGQVADFQAGRTADRALVVLGHHPFYATTERSLKDKLNIANSEEVRPLLDQAESGTAFYICGHNHINSIFGPDETGWTFVQCGAPLVAFSYRVITLDEQGSQVETVDFGLDEPDFKAKLTEVYAGLEHFGDIELETAAGQESDRRLALQVVRTS